MSEQKIKIIKDGPYIVSGNIPLSEKIIVPKGKHYEYEDGKPLPQAKVYSLCRCGKSKNPPFCDGMHEKINFDGTETASREKFEDRLVRTVIGPGLDLLDDGRCALARFCHRENGHAWNLTKQSDNPENKEEAIRGASECPAGRIVAVEKNGEVHEDKLEPSIDILYDQEKGVIGPIYVKGNIKIESSDGTIYEIRNRITLCRCGESENKPFCDARHLGKEEYERIFLKDRTKK